MKYQSRMLRVINATFIMICFQFVQKTFYNGCTAFKNYNSKRGLSTSTFQLSSELGIKSPFGFQGGQVESMIDRSSILWKSCLLSNVHDRRVEIQYAEAQKGDEIMDFCIENNLPEAFGIVSWESSIAILPELSSKIQFLKSSAGNANRQLVVCDVGCGTGMVSVASLAYGASKVIALDYNVFSLHYTRRTFLRNIECLQKTIDKDLSDRNIELAYFDLSDCATVLPPADLYVFSDLLYTAELARIVGKRVKEVLYSPTSVRSKTFCLVSDPKRRTASHFMEELGVSTPASTGKRDDGSALVPNKIFVKLNEDSNYSIYDCSN